MMNIKQLCQKYKEVCDEISIYDVKTDKFIIMGPDNNTTISYENKYFIRLLKNQREILLECVNNPHSVIENILEQIEHFSPSDYNKQRICTPIKTSSTIDESINQSELIQIKNSIMKNVDSFIIESLELGTEKQEINYYNNYDVEINYNHSMSYVACSLVKSDNEGNKYTDYEFNYLNPNWINASFNIIEFVDSIKNNINNKLKSECIKSGNYNCIIVNKLVGYLISRLIKMICGSKLVQKQSLFIDKLNQKILNKSISIIEIPNKGPHKYFWDDFGNERKNLYLVKCGNLNSYILSNNNANKLNLPKTNHTIFFNEQYGNIHLEIEQHIRKSCLDCKQYLIIQDFIGLQINENNGDFSVSCSGSIVNDNKIHGFTNGIIKSNLIDLFNNCVFLDDIYHHSTIFTPSIFIENISINGE